MPKIKASELMNKVQAKYNPKDKSRDMIGTGSSLKRPSKPEDFILAGEGSPWVALTGLLGLPYDSIVQIAGSPDAGKSTIAGQFMAWAQKQGIYVILLDTEKKFDKVRFEKHFGGISDELNVISTTIIRKGVGAMLKYIDTIMEADKDARILLVHDSIGGSVSRARSERDFDDEKNAQPGSEAVENSEYMRYIVSRFDKFPGRISLLLINQMTDKIGPMPGKSRSGGNKISFHSSLIVEMSRVQDLTKIQKGIKVKTGIISRAKIAKNHLSQTENSVHEMRIKVTAKGWENLDESTEEPEAGTVEA